MSETLIGVARPRIDAPDKVTGATRFAADGYVHGLLHARPILSTEPHARIRQVDREAALSVPGVVAVLIAADLPMATAGTDRTAEPLAREEVVFAGQPVALVGETSLAGLPHMLGEPFGCPRPLPQVRFADKALHAFPTPLHAHGPGTGP